MQTCSVSTLYDIHTYVYIYMHTCIHTDNDDVSKQTTALKVLGECLVKGNLCYLYEENTVRRTYHKINILPLYIPYNWNIWWSF